MRSVTASSSGIKPPWSAYALVLALGGADAGTRVGILGIPLVGTVSGLGSCSLVFTGVLGGLVGKGAAAGVFFLSSPAEGLALGLGLVLCVIGVPGRLEPPWDRVAGVFCLSPVCCDVIAASLEDLLGSFLSEPSWIGWSDSVMFESGFFRMTNETLIIS